MADSTFSTTTVGDEVPGKQKSIEKLCQPCINEDKRTEAKYWCLNCVEFLCSTCYNAHKRFNMFRDHKIVAAGEASNVTGSYDMKGVDQCKQHSELLKFLCEDDDELCCSTCAIVKHRRCHSVVEIEYAAKTKVSDLTNIRQDLLDTESKTKAYAQRLISIREKAATNAIEINNKIQEMQDKVNDMFENLKRNVAKETQAFQQQAFRENDLKNDVCNNYITDLTAALSDVDSVSQQGTPTQQLIMAHHLKDSVKTLGEKTDKDIAELKDIYMSFDFDQSIQLPPTKNTTPGNLTMKYVPSDVIKSIDSKNSQQEDQKVKLTLLASIDLKQGKIDLKQGKSDVEEPFYSGLDFLPDGRLVAVDNMNKKCLVYNQKLENVGSVLLPQHPFDVTVMTDENVAVSGGKDIYFVEISKQSNVKVTRTLKVTIKSYSIYLMTDDNFLVGCYDDPQPVRVLSVGGEEKSLNINFSSKQYKRDESTLTYIKNSDKIVLSDRFAHTVYIYDIANNTRVDVKDEKIIKEPRGMAVGPSDCIFVCSMRTHSMVQISHTGQILSSHALDMQFPCSVSVSKDNILLAVSDGAVGKQKLQLYKIELI